MTSRETAAEGIVIVGGGIAGLAAAHRVLELAAARGARVPLTLVEAGQRLGGTITSERVDGFLVEAGADSLLTEKPWALDLCRRLGIEDRLIATRDDQRRTFVVHAGRLHPLPEGFLLLAPTRLWPLVTSRLFSWRGKLRMACDLVLPRGGSATGDESLASFVTRRLGREALERVAQPLAGGIYTADPARLSLAATMPRFLEMERRHRSVILAMRRAAQAGAARGSGARWSLFVSFADGMQTLVSALEQRLPEGSVRLGARALAIAPGPTGGWRVALDGGTALEAARVLVATPAFAAADLLRPLDATLAAELAAIPYASSATVTLAYDRGAVSHPLDGFGFVVPAIEGRTLIACSFSSVKYAGRAPAGGVLLRVFCGGALAEQMFTLSDAALVAAARRELSELLGIEAAPRFTRVHRYPRAMPQYQVGHLERVAAIEARLARHPGLALAGNAYRGVGVPDCVHSGERAAEALLGGARGERAAEALLGAAT
jgi:oxygen-dependent protoporphyrinogen oxidase